MRIIGLTGGIGTGKSTVTEYLRDRGYYVIDADQIAREIVEPGSDTLARLAETFGSDIIREDGSLDRPELARIAFASPERQAELNRIMHGKVIDIIAGRIEDLRDGGGEAVFVDAPLMYESGLDRLMEEVWVVDAEDQVRLRRVMERDKATAEQVQLRIDRQMSREDRLSRADRVIDNSGSTEELYRQIDRLTDKM